MTLWFKKIFFRSQSS